MAACPVRMGPRAAAATRRRSTSGVGCRLSRACAGAATARASDTVPCGSVLSVRLGRDRALLKKLPAGHRDEDWHGRSTTVALVRPTVTVQPHTRRAGRRLAAAVTLVVCARLRIILIYSITRLQITSAASPSPPANTHAHATTAAARFFTGLSVSRRRRTT